MHIILYVECTIICFNHQLIDILHSCMYLCVCMSMSIVAWLSHYKFLEMSLMGEIKCTILIHSVKCPTRKIIPIYTSNTANKRIHFSNTRFYQIFNLCQYFRQKKKKKNLITFNWHFFSEMFFPDIFPCGYGHLYPRFLNFLVWELCHFSP